MPKFVEVGNEVVEFPDDMPNSEIEGVLKQQLKPRTLAEDLFRQGGLTIRGTVGGLTSIPTIVGDALNTVVNKSMEAAGMDTRLPMASDAVQNLMTDAGLPVPETQLERAVQSGVGAMTGVGVQSQLAKASPLLAPLGQNLGLQTATAGVSAPVAQATAESVTEATENPFVGLAAGLATGTLAGGAVVKAYKTGQPTPKTVTIEDVRKKAQDSYTTVKQMGIEVKADSAKALVNRAVDDLKEFNFNPALEEHKSINTVLQTFKQNMGNDRVSLQTIEQLRSAATQLKMSRDPVTRLLAGRVVQSVDEYMGNLKPVDIVVGQANTKQAIKELQSARHNWKVAARAQVLEDVLDIASARALNPAKSENELIRSGLINLAANKNRMKLFSSQEQDAIRQAASGGVKDSLLSLVARFNPQRSHLATAATVGTALYSPQYAALTAGTAATGFAADKLQQAYRVKSVKDAMTQILTGEFRNPNKAGEFQTMFSGLMGAKQGMEEGE